MVVVTGARGSIGAALMERLPDAVGIDIEDWDIREPWLPRVFTPDLNPKIVVHLAASKDAPEGEVDPDTVWRTNVAGTANVLARWPKAKVVLASTCKACAPETVYGATKLIGERLVLNRGGSVARFHNVVETRGNVFEKWAATNGSLPVTDCVRYFIHIDDALDLLVAVMELPPGRYLMDPGAPLHMGSVAEAHYPGRARHIVPPRRGDRLVEPLVAPHETLEQNVEFPRIYHVDSPHD